jgi:hypothetical protein
LKDANEQKENAKRALVSLTADLDEQRNKVKIIAEMLVFLMFSVVYKSIAFFDVARLLMTFHSNKQGMTSFPIFSFS